MGYDLFFLAEVPGQDPMDVLEAHEEDEREPTPEEAARAARLGAALQEALPGLRDNAGDLATPGEVHLLDEAGLEVSVLPHAVEVAFPYWDSLDTAALTRDLARVAALVEEHLGWRAFDPQQEAWVDLRGDTSGLAEAFEHGRGITRRVLGEG